MFQSLRPNSQLYIFYKGDTPRLERAFVINQPIVKPKYQVPATFGSNEMVVDLSVKINGQTINYNGLPANLDIADTCTNGESIVVADNKEAMNAEILSMKQKSIDIINSIDFHKNMIGCCDTILAELNPEYAEKRQQQDEINTLKNQINDMAQQISELMKTNRSLVDHFNGGHRNENVGN